MKNNIIIVGGASGIGKACYNRIKGKDDIISLTYNTKKINFDLIEGDMKYQLDLSLKESIDKFTHQYTKEKHDFNGLVFSITPKILLKPFLKIDDESFIMHFSIQTMGLIRLLKSFENLILKKTHKKIVIVLSDSVIGKPPSHYSHYVTAKYSLLGLSKSLAVEFNKYNCQVNMVSPGMTNTDLLSTYPKKLVELEAEKNPMKRIAKPEDIANVVAFLLSKKSNYLNGVNIPVNGGSLFN